jgi:hypothetical protein
MGLQQRQCGFDAIRHGIEQELRLGRIALLARPRTDRSLGVAEERF